MMAALILAASLRASIGLELDLSALMQRHADAARIKRTLRCGIKVPGHTIVAPPGARVTLRRRSYVVPAAGEISFVDQPDSGSVIVNGRRVSLAHGDQDQFGFRRVEAGQ